jgi:hypothetical protein
MRLEPAEGEPVDNPNDADIAAAVSDERNEFVILSADEEGETFIQTSGGLVEYRAGQTRQLFRSPDNLPADQVIALMQAYNRGEQSYKSAVQWQDVSAESQSGAGAGVKRSVAVVILLLIVVALVVWLANLGK